MCLDLCLKQLHVVHITVFHRMQYIRLLLFYSVIFQSCKFQSPFVLCTYLSDMFLILPCDKLGK